MTMMTAPVCKYADDAAPADDEARLVAAIQAGDGRGWETLVGRYAPRMFTVAKRLLRCEQEAADAVQDAFVSAFGSLHRFRAESRLSTWLHRIVVNAALMKLRTRARRRERLPQDLLPAFDDTGRHAQPVQAWSDDTLRLMEAAETRALVRACIDKLPGSFRSVLMLRDIEQMDTRTTAKFLGLSEANVKTQLHRARQALRRLLEPHFLAVEGPN